jgi:hypothetical protein
MYVDGTSNADVLEFLESRGVTGLSIQADPPLLRRLLAAGRTPILSLRRNGGKHAVVAVGYSGLDVRGTFEIVDPRTGPERLSAADLWEQWRPYGGQALLLFRGSPEGLPERSRLEAQDRIYRAEARAARSTTRTPEGNRTVAIRGSSEIR